MSIYKETSEVWNKLAPLYEERFMYLNIYNETYDLFCSLIDKQNAKILDIACGPGNIMHYVLAKRSDFHIHGIDVAPNMIDLAKKNIPAATFSIMDFRNIKDLDTIYDGIIFGFGLPYLLPEDSSTFLSDVYSMLSSNGVFYISFMDGNADQSEFKTGSTGDKVYFNYYPLEQISKTLTAIGFENIRSFKVPYQKPDGTTEEHTIVVCIKKGEK